MNDANLASTTSLSALWLNRPSPAAGCIGKVADLSAIYADFLGAGSKQDWMVGLETLQSPGGHALMFRTDQANAADRVYYTITATGWQYGNGYGASWTFRDGNGNDRIFFAANNAAGIFELDVSSVSLDSTTTAATTNGVLKGTGSFTLNKIGTGSASMTSNDGISCPTAYIPFPT